MNNLDSLQSANSQLPVKVAGARLPNSSNDVGNTAATTPSGGNVLPVEPSGQAQSAQQTAEQIEAVVQQLEGFTQSLQRALSFSVDDLTGQTVITVRDSQSDEVVRQIPSEELVALARKLQELQESQENLGGAAGNLLEVRV